MFVDALLNASRRDPTSVAAADGVRSLTFRQLAQLAAVLRGIVSQETACERVGVMLPASSTFPAVLMGVFWSSKIAIPLNFLLNPDELASVVNDAEPGLIVTVRHFRDLAARLPARALFLEDLPLRRKLVLAALRRLPPAPRTGRDDTAVILYTSGTTGQPKGVQLSYENLYSNCVDTIASLKIHPPQTFLNVLPPFHVFGLTTNVLVPLVLSASVYAVPRFSPLAVVQTIAQRRITMIMAIPSMYAALLRTKSATREAFSSVLLAISGGEPLPDQVRRAFEERFGVILKEGYGLTETSPVVAACGPDEYRHGTVGKPIRNVELRLLSSDGNMVSPGDDGEILVRGPGVMKGYYRRPEETRQVLDSEGWFRTGDVGHLAPDGFLVLTGRAKEMLIIGGENVFPREIEAVLERHEGVDQAAVVGVRDDLRGETPVAFVIPKPATRVTEAELRRFAKQALAGFKVPRRIEIREDLPRGPTGKILKRRLRKLL